VWRLLSCPASPPGPAYSPGDISTIAPITDLRKSNAGEVWEAVDREGKVLIVKNNRPKAVIVSWERSNEMQENPSD
jgi:prevent-host-death family protein